MSDKSTPWRERQERLDAEVDTSRTSLQGELARAARLVPRTGRVALFTVPSAEEHKIAIIKGLKPAPEDSTLVVHNYRSHEEGEPPTMTITAAWLFGQKFIHFSEGAVWLRNDTDEWETDIWAPRIVSNRSYLSLPLKRDIFWAQDGVPVQDTANYPADSDGLRHHNTPEQAKMLAAGACALQLCTTDSLERAVTNYVPHLMVAPNQ
jgi:hypothetical protein